MHATTTVSGQMLATILPIVTVNNKGAATTVGAYTMEVVTVGGHRVAASRYPLPPTVTLRSPTGAVLRGQDTSLEGMTSVLPIQKDRSITGALLFTVPLPQSVVMRKGTKLVLHYADMIGGKHEMNHVVNLRSDKNKP